MFVSWITSILRIFARMTLRFTVVTIVFSAILQLILLSISSLNIYHLVVLLQSDSGLL